MTDRHLTHLLGSRAGDPGCDAAFEVLDQYAEAVLRGDDLTVKYLDVTIHIGNCVSCGEDAEGLLMGLRSPDG